MDLINISNHPSDSTIKRKANRAGIITDEHNAYELKYVNLNVLVKHFKEELFRMSWYMRGGVNINDLFYLYSHEDREAIYVIIKENIETTKETQLPLI